MYQLLDHAPEKLLDHLFDRLPVGTAVIDRNFLLLRCNPTWVEFIARYTPSAAADVVPGVSLFDLEPGTESTIKPLFALVFAGETVRREDVRLESGGIVSYWDVLLVPVEVDGEIVAVLDVSLDVTERVMAQQRLQDTLESLHRSQERLALAQQGTTDGIWDWNVLTGEVYFSPRWKNMLGFQEEELENNFDTWQHLIHPEDRQQTLAILHDHLEGKQQTYRIEHRLRHKDGSYRWILSRGAAVRDENGRPVRMAGSHTDITQQLEAEEDLRQRIIFEKIVTTISNKLINMPPDEIGRGIKQALRTIGIFTGADRAYIFLYTEDGRSMSCIEEWCIEGIPPQIHRLQDVVVDSLAWSNRQLQQQQVLHISSVAALPPEAAAEKEEFQNRGIQSLLVAPLTYQEGVVGFLGIDAVRREMEWTAVSISLLQIVGEIFINALEHKRSREALQSANRLLEQRVVERTLELERRNQELDRQRRGAESLRSVLALLNSNSPLSAVLEVITRQASELMGGDTAVAIFQHDPSRERFDLRASHKLPKYLRQLPSVPVSAIGGESFKQRQLFVIPDVARHVEELLPQLSPAEPELILAFKELRACFRSYLAVPLVVRDTLFGGIAFHFTDERALDEEDVTLAMTLSEQAALAIQNARLRDHAEEAAVMAERNRLARELHDAVTQTLFSASLIADVLPRIWERSPELGQAKLVELRELTRGALAEMRTLLLELRPATLTESSLDELLQQLAAAVIGRSRVQVNVRLEGEEKRPLLSDTQVALYRIAQEALNNVVKHSGATEVTVTLRFAPECVVLEVADNGRGFDPTAASIHSLGLGIMRERAAKINAKLQVDSIIGKGTKVRVEVGE